MGHDRYYEEPEPADLDAMEEEQDTRAAPLTLRTRTVRGNDAREWLDCWPQGCGLVVPGARVAWPAHVLPVGRDRVRTRTSPEAWHAEVLRFEAEQLMAAVQMLAHQEGYHDGLAEARVAA